MIFKKIEDLRDENNITQAELATAVGRTREWYTKMLRRKDITYSDLVKIAKALNVDLSVIVERESSVNLKKAPNETYNKNLDSMIETNQKTLEAMLEMRKQLDETRERLYECEKENLKLKSIQLSKRK